MAAMDKLELGQVAKTLLRRLCRATKSLNLALDHTQLASFANAGVRYASMATVDVGVRTVQNRLCSLQAQALRVSICALPCQADHLAKYTDSLPISNQSLGESLRAVVVKTASTACDYAAMAEGFVQTGL